MHLKSRIQNMVYDFHLTYDRLVSESPGQFISLESKIRRVKLIEEEFTELKESLEGNDLRYQAKELGDLAYVIFGSAVEWGIPLEEVIAAIHESNMSKLDSNGKPIINSWGKVLKGPHYHEPDIGAVLWPDNHIAKRIADGIKVSYQHVEGCDLGDWYYDQCENCSGPMIEM